MRKIDVAPIWRPIITQSDFLDILDDQLSVCEKLSEIPENEDVVDIYTAHFKRTPSVYMTKAINYVLKKHRDRIADKVSRKYFPEYLEYCDDCGFYGYIEYANAEDFTRYMEWLQDK